MRCCGSDQKVGRKDSLMDEVWNLKILRDTACGEVCGRWVVVLWLQSCASSVAFIDGAARDELTQRSSRAGLNILPLASALSMAAPWRATPTPIRNDDGLSTFMALCCVLYQWRFARTSLKRRGQVHLFTWLVRTRNKLPR